MSEIRNCIHKDCIAYNEKYDFNCEINTFTFEINFCKRYMENRCPVCGQKLDSDITGEYPCQSCGIPTSHDKPKQEESDE